MSQRLGRRKKIEAQRSLLEFTFGNFTPMSLRERVRQKYPDIDAPTYPNRRQWVNDPYSRLLANSQIGAYGNKIYPFHWGDMIPRRIGRIRTVEPFPRLGPPPYLDMFPGRLFETYPGQYDLPDWIKEVGYNQAFHFGPPLARPYAIFSAPPDNLAKGSKTPIGRLINQHIAQTLIDAQTIVIDSIPYD